MIPHVLDYRPTWDEKNRKYPINSFLLSASGHYPQKSHQYWWEGNVLNQGSEGACVGFGWVAELLASPQRVLFKDPNSTARSVYQEAKKIDRWNGEDYEGTSVLAGAKVVRSMGLISEYRWAFTVEEIIQTIKTVGPVVVGIPWFESMYQTRPSGLVNQVGASDRQVGGHCITLTGYTPGRRFKGEGIFKRFEVFKWRNSWGEDYGLGGSGYIRVEDFEFLFKIYGEACIPIGRSLHAHV